MDDYLIQDPKHQNILIALICAGAFIANLDATIVNISFELIPPELVTGIITEKGLVTPYSVATMMEPEKMSKRMMQKLAKWIG